MDMESVEDQKKLCTPFIIYVTVAVIALVWQIVNKQFKGMAVNVVLNVLVAVIIFWLCSRGSMTGAWVMVVLFVVVPLILIGLLFLAVYGMGYHVKKNDGSGQWPSMGPGPSQPPQPTQPTQPSQQYQIYQPLPSQFQQY